MALPAFAVSSPPRIAVISGGDGKNLASLLTAELSSNPLVTLVERDDLAKIGDELKVEQMAGNDASALGRLVGADGLLFLDQRADGIHVRFTAVNLGYALFDDPVPSAVDPQQEAKALAHLVENDAPKLKLDSGRAVPISVLNLRADYATTNALQLERDLTLLVEDQLAAVPEYVVLERRHAWSLGFERSLAPVPPTLAEGAFVIDGTLSQPDANQMIVHLRVRSPHGEPVESMVQGSPQDLTAMSQKLVAEIRKITGSSSSMEWHPENEAHEYFLEGIWGWQHKVDAPALEALDSAELLGEKAPQLFAVRSEVLGAISGEDLKIENERIILPDGPAAQPADQRAAMILRAIHDAVRFRDFKSAPPLSPDPAVLQATQWIDPVSSIIPLTSNILVLFDGDAPAQSDVVRTALRELTMFDPEHGTLSPFYAMGYSTARDLFLEEWPATLDEQLAAYRMVGANASDWVPSVMLKNGDGFCQRFLKTSEEQHRQFDTLVQSLKDVPTARMRYLLIMSSSPDATKADAAYKAYLGELWAQRDTFVHTRDIPPDWCSGRDLPDEVKRRNATAGLPLLHYVLTNRDRCDASDVPLSILWEPAGWSHDDASLIWKEYLVYKARVKGINSNIFFDTFDNSFARQFPDLAVDAPFPSPSKEALVVTKFWYPWRYTSAAPAYYYGGIVATDGQHVWEASQKIPDPAFVVQIDLTDFSSHIFPNPASPGSNAFSFAAMPDTLYAVGERARSSS